MIEPPKYQKDAIPTLKGWKHPKRNEILQAKRFTQEQIDEYMANVKQPVKKKKPQPKPKAKPVEKLKREPKTLKEIQVIGANGEVLITGLPVIKRKENVPQKSIVKRVDEPKQNPKPKAKSPVLNEYDYTSILMKGSTGPGVLKMSTELGKPNEYFGQDVEWALKDFQAKKGLVEDGIFGPRTQAILYGKDDG